MGRGVSPRTTVEGVRFLRGVKREKLDSGGTCGSVQVQVSECVCVQVRVAECSVYTPFLLRCPWLYVHTVEVFFRALGVRTAVCVHTSMCVVGGGLQTIRESLVEVRVSV